MPIRLRRNRAGLALLAVAAALALGACSSKPKPTFAIVHATVIDASGSEPNPDTTVLLAAQRILAVGPAESLAIPPGTPRPDATGVREFCRAPLAAFARARGQVFARTRDPQTGTAVFLGGLKKGSGTTRALTVCRTASTVISMPSVLPGAAYARSTQASATIFFSVGDQVVEVALPACRPSRYAGTATREAMPGTCGAMPSLS